MHRISLVLLVSILLAGCGKIDQVSTDMKAKMDETKDAQSLAMALDLLYNSKEFNIRAAAAETVFTLGYQIRRERLHHYVGAPFSITIAAVSSDLPNVTIVGTKPDLSRGIAPVSDEVYEILRFSALKVLKLLSYKSSQPGLSEDDVADVKSKTKAMFYVGTAILGARHQENLSQYYRNNPDAIRTEGANLLRGLAAKLEFSDAERGELNTLLDVRMKK